MATGFSRETNYTVDDLLFLQEAAILSGASANSSVVDLGAASEGNEEVAAENRGDVVIDIAAIEIATGDESYTFNLVGSDTVDFTGTDQEDLVSLELGPAAVLLGDVDSDTGRYILPYTNARNTRRYRFVRIELIVAGTVATGINWKAFIGRSRNA